MLYLQLNCHPPQVVTVVVEIVDFQHDTLPLTEPFSLQTPSNNVNNKQLL